MRNVDWGRIPSEPNSCRVLSSLNQALPCPTGFSIRPRWAPTKVSAGSLPDPCQVSAGFYRILTGLNRISTGLLLGPQWISSLIETPIEPYEPLLSPPVEPLSIRPAEPLSKPLSKRHYGLKQAVDRIRWRAFDALPTIRAFAEETPIERLRITACSCPEKGRGVADESACRPEQPIESPDARTTARQYGRLRKSSQSTDNRKTSPKPLIETPPEISVEVSVEISVEAPATPPSKCSAQAALCEL